MRYVNAGHVPPLVLRPDGSLERLETGGAPVGLFAEWRYREGVCELGAGDLIVACTDGVTEAESASGEVWGIEGLARAAGEARDRRAGEVVEAVFRALDRFTGVRLGDDATVVAVRVR